MPRNIDPNLFKLFGPAGLEALIKGLLVELNILRDKTGITGLEYNAFIQSVLDENSDIVIPKE